MPSYRFAAVALCAVMLLGSGCSRISRSSRDYIEESKRHMGEKRLKDASIALRKAIQKDPNSTEAHVLLARVEFELGAHARAAANIRHALTLRRNDSSIMNEAAQYYLHLLLSDPRRDTELTGDLSNLARELEQVDSGSFQAARIRGYLALSDRNFSDAVLHFRKAHEARPDHPETSLALLRSFTGVGDYVQAEKIAVEGLRRSPEYGPLYDAAYLLYSKTNQTRKAEELIKARISHNPSDAQARIQLAYHYRTAGQSAAEEAVLNEMLQVSAIPSRFLSEGEYYKETGQLPKALALFQEGLGRDRSNVLEYQIKVLDTLAAQGKTGEAVKLVEEYLKADPDQDRLLAAKGVLLLSKATRSDAEAAVTILRRLVRKSPEEDSLRYDLGRAYLAAGDPDAAKAEWKQVLRNQPAYEAPVIALAELALQEGNAKDALHWASHGLDINSASQPLKVLHASALLASGKINEARKQVESDLLHAPKSRDLLAQKGLVLLAEKDFSGAQRLFQDLHQTDRDDLRALQGLIDAYLAQGSFEAASRLLQAEEARSPGRVLIQEKMGQVALSSGQYEAAAKSYRTLVAKNPGSVTYQLRLSEALYSLNQLPEAVAALRKAAELAPSSVPVQLSLAWVLTQAQKLDEGETIYRAVLAKNPRQKVALTNLAELVLQRGNHDEALQLAQRALQESPDDPNVAQTLGTVYLGRGDARAAERIFTGLVSRFPHNVDYLVLCGRSQSLTGDAAKAKQTLQKALAETTSRDKKKEIESYLARVN